MAKLLIALMRDRPMPGKSRIDVPMEKRVQYAIDSIEGDTPEKDQAIEFLHKVKDRLDDPELVAKVDQALREVGNA